MIKTAFINGKWIKLSGEPAPVLDKYLLEPFGGVIRAESDTTALAVQEAQRAFETSPLSPEGRSKILEKTADLIDARSDELADIIIREGGFMRSEASKEVSRAALVFRHSAEEALRLNGEMIPFDGIPGGAGKTGFLQRHPIGVICAITPFNGPLNTPAHKIGPAIAAGNTVVIKPARETPFSACALCDILQEAGLPDGHLNLINGEGTIVGQQLLEDDRIAFYHFTGSTAVGRRIANTVGLRQTSLELGSVAATIICDDAHLEAACAASVAAAYAKAGQVCTSTQILFVEAGVADAVRDRVVEIIKPLTAGNPRDASNRCGPMISEKAAERVSAWIEASIDKGARLLWGGARERSTLQPTLLDNIHPEDQFLREELFGPAMCIVPVASIDEAIDRYNAGRYGLAAGVFTQSLDKASKASRRLRSGTIHINNASSGRLDPMPFGGVKDSGHGKEGPKYAVEEMTERRLVVLHGF